MTTTPPSEEYLQSLHAHRLHAFLLSRARQQLEHGELDRYHSEDCSSGHAQQFDVSACDCDGPEFLRDLVQAVLAAAGALWLDSPSDRLQLLALAGPWRNWPDFPTPEELTR